jgi:hypothetical protein
MTGTSGAGRWQYRSRMLLSCNDWNDSGCSGCHRLAVPAGKPQLVAQLHSEPTVHAIGLAHSCVPDMQTLRLQLPRKMSGCRRSNLHALLLHHNVNQLHSAFLLQLTGVSAKISSKRAIIQHKGRETKKNARSLLAAIRRHLVPAHADENYVLSIK